MAAGNRTADVPQEPRRLYAAAGIAALAAALVFRRWLGAELSLLSSIGVFSVGVATRPSTVLDWFALLQSHSLAAVTLLNGLDLVNYALVALVILGLSAALRRSSGTAAIVALVLAVIGEAVYFASNQAFALLSLSRQYFAAATDAEKSQLLSAGQAFLATSNPAAFGTGVFWGFTFVTVSCLILSCAMVRSQVFSRITGCLGITASALGLGYFFLVILDPPLVFIPLSASAPVLLVWYLFAGVRLLKLSRSQGPSTP